MLIKTSWEIKRKANKAVFTFPRRNAGRVAPGAQVSSEEDLGRVSCWEGHRPGWGGRGGVPEHRQSGQSLGAPLPGQQGHLTLTLGLLPRVSAAPSWGLCLRSDPRALPSQAPQPVGNLLGRTLIKCESQEFLALPLLLGRTQLKTILLGKDACHMPLNADMHV